MKDISLLDKIIIGRVEPHIYAFETNTIPNYLKVGDTYRPVSVRLNEWRQYYPDLEKKYDDIAKVNQDAYYRDFAIHSFLENEKRRRRLQPEDLTPGLYYSQEFFENATSNDIEEAVDEIRKDYKDGGGRYKFYNVEDNLPEIFQYNRTETYNIRQNQSDVVTNFINAYKSGHTNLLMYAVMRFGKSFTSMCCALQMNAKVVLIVSAKADVEEEWKRTIESHIKFKDFVFINGKILERDEKIITKNINQNRKVAIFLTLEDLQGMKVKEKHKEVFIYSEKNCLDLLIIDETHFGARAEKYGSVLREYGKKEIKDIQNKRENEDFFETSEAEERIKILKAKVKLHLSGTPYRILMGGEFSNEDVIAFYPYSKLVKDKDEWDIKNLDKKDEWDNPYFGFPQMIRFAFNLNQSSISKLEQLKKSGETCAFSALFRTKSLKKDKQDNVENYKKFIYEKEIIDFLEVIDGTKEDNELLGFLDYEGIKKGNMCHHIVMVLPYRASCDAMEELIKNNSNKFKNIKEYTVVNISGLNPSIELKKAADVKRFIADCEEKKKKTLTLTVNRMMTGSTVPEWDTMLYLKDTSSPQEYDQAIFRLQNQYIKNVSDGNGKIVKYNMKPQTLLVDFIPERLFRIQEQRAQIYNVNINDVGNSNLEERISDELKISPVIILNKNKIVEVEATDIVSALSEYSKSRGVAEETGEIPVDLSLMEYDVIRKAIEGENEIGSKNGFTIKSVQGKETDFDIPPADGNEGDNNKNQERTKANKEADKDPVKQFRSYYARILFFSFLTRDSVKSLSDVIEAIGKKDNNRIAKNVGISKRVLTKIKEKISIFVLRDLDYKIYNLNKLSKDPSLDPLERAKIAVQKFGKLGESEVITPSELCNKMIGTVPDDAFVDAIQNKHKILNIAGKAGEFEVAVYERYLKLGRSEKEIKDIIYSIPTSGLTYEFTRKVYEILGLNIKNIAEKIDCYSLLSIKTGNNYDWDRMGTLLSQNKSFNTISIDDSISGEERRVQFDIVVGNPPYQIHDGGNGASAKPIYPVFINLAKNISPKYVSMIIPARWYAGGKGLTSFRGQMLGDSHIRELVDYSNSSDCFPGVNVAGGICYFLWDYSYAGACRVSNMKGVILLSEMTRPLGEYTYFVRNNGALEIIRKVLTLGEALMSNTVLSRNYFGLPTTIDGERTPFEGGIRVLTSKGDLYIERDCITDNDSLLDKYKVVITYAMSGGNKPSSDGKYQVLSSLMVLKPNEVCSETYLILGAFNSENEADNLVEYMSGQFARFLLLQALTSIHITKDRFCFVPIQDFSKTWTDKLLYEKYDISEDEIRVIESLTKPMLLEDDDE